MTVRARKIKAITTDDGEVVEGDALEKLLADPARPLEWPDPTPMAPPIGYKAGPSLIEQMRAMVRTELSQIAQDNDHETFADAEDFDVDDDYDPTSPWEMDFEPEELQAMHPEEAVKHAQEAKDAEKPDPGVSGAKAPDAKPPSPSAAEPPLAKPTT